MLQSSRYETYGTGYIPFVPHKDQNNKTLLSNMSFLHTYLLFTSISLIGFSYFLLRLVTPLPLETN